MADICCLAMTGKKPGPTEALYVQILIGLLISNGPGSITAQGAKGAVSADGPQTPGRVQINKAMVGFLTHSGYSHGGNGFEGMAFLLAHLPRVVEAEPVRGPEGGVGQLAELDAADLELADVPLRPGGERARPGWPTPRATSALARRFARPFSSA